MPEPVTELEVSPLAAGGMPAPRVSAAPRVAPKRARGITARAVAIGFLLVPVNSFWVVYSEAVRYAAHPTTTSLFFNVVFCIAVLVALNALLKRFLPRWAFTQAELLIIYTILSLGTAMAGHDLGQVLISSISYPAHYATPENKWPQL